MLLNTLREMNELHDRLTDFLTSNETTLSLEADQYGGAQPYDELLRGLHIEKGQGPINLSVTGTRWLALSGSVENLKVYCGHFRFEEAEESEHHHPEHGPRDGYMQKGSMDLVIEVRSDVIEDLRSRRH